MQVSMLWRVAAVAIFCIPGRAAAQDSEPPDMTRVAAARRFIEASGSASSMAAAMRAAIPAQRAAMPDIPAEFWTRLEQRFERELPQLIDTVAVIYAGLFTAAELDGLTDFYRSPLGQRLRDTQPSLIAATSEAGQRWGMRIGAAIGAELGIR